MDKEAIQKIIASLRVRLDKAIAEREQLRAQNYALEDRISELSAEIERASNTTHLLNSYLA
jgi:chromosome segregation ATPase